MASCLVAAGMVVLLFQAHLPLPAPTTAAAYLGNTETHKFHRRSCRHASCRKCTAKFATREEALHAGYRPCDVCNP